MSFDSRTFLTGLRHEIATHPGVNHVFLSRCATNPFTRQDYKVMGMQHYPLVGLFTHYMERLLINAPDSDCKQWIAKVLVDEHGEGSEGEDHAQMYRHYLTSCGVAPGEEDRVPLDPRVVSFVRTHLELVEEHFLVGLGALGPGHEWAIPKMFALVIEGLEAAGFSHKEIVYFKLHVVQDEDRGAWLEEALVDLIKDERDAERVWEGAMRSLEARRLFWDGVQSQVVQWRQPARRVTFKQKLRERVASDDGLMGKMARRAGRGLVFRPQVRALAGL
jgi:pyrroloquinoline-quinone synthase